MIEVEEAERQSAHPRMSHARSEFVGTLGRRLAALRNTLHQLEDDPASRERRDMLLRRVHALGSAARVLGFEGVAEALEGAERALGKSAGGGAVASTDLAEVSRAIDVLPSIAWGAKPPPTSELPEDADALISGWPLCILVYGPSALQTSLSAAEDELVEVELAADPESFRDLAERVGPDVAVIDGDLREARQIIDNLAHDPNVPPFPVVVVGSFDHPEAATAFVSLGASRVLPKPVGPDSLWRAVLEVSRHSTGLRAPREPIGDVTVDELAQRITAEIRRGLVEGVDPASARVSVPLGEGTDVLAAVWGAVARVRELLTMRSRGGVRFSSGGPEGAVPLAPWTGPERRAGERGGGLRRSDGVRLEGRRAVVVDDDPAVVWFLSGLLRTSGVEVAEAHDGISARQLVLDTMPDLVVSDVLMPGIDGFTLCRDIKNDVAVRDVPVILLSWKEDLLQRVRELGAGADGYLRKEAAASTVLSRIREVLRPRSRVESRLTGGGEVRGRLDGLTTRTLLEIARRHQPSSRITVRDSVYLYEAEMRDGELRCITRTASDGSFERGAKVLDALIGVSAGRFVVAPSAAPARRDFSGSLEELLRPRIRRARALARLFHATEIEHLDSVLIDVDTVGAYLDATPEPARALFARLLEGMGPRAILESAPAQRYFLEQVLADIARRGAVVEVARDGELVDLDAPSPASVEAAREPELDASPAPLFTLNLSPAPPDVADAVQRWEQPDVVVREASLPLPLSRSVTPLPVMRGAPETGFGDEPRTAPGMGPVSLPVQPEAGPASSAPEPEPTEDSAPQSSQTGDPAMNVEPALETARSEEIARSPSGDEDEEAISLVSQRETQTPETLRVDSSPKAARGTLEAGPEADASLPKTKPIEFPRKKLGSDPPTSKPAPTSKPVSSSKPAPTSKPASGAQVARPAARPAPRPGDEKVGFGKMVVMTGAAAALAFGAITLVRTKLLPPAEPAAEPAATDSAAPALAKPKPPPGLELAVTEQGIEVGTSVSNDKGVIDVNPGENHPVYVDGAFVGRGRRKVPVAPGPHQVVVKAPTGDASVQVDVKVARRFVVAPAAPAP